VRRAHGRRADVRRALGRATCDVRRARTCDGATVRRQAACVVALFACGALVVQARQDDPDRKVAGGIPVKGWEGTTDPAGSTSNKQGLTISDSKFAPEGKGFRVSHNSDALVTNFSVK
jgi:hypothetical protein